MNLYEPQNLMISFRNTSFIVLALLQSISVLDFMFDGQIATVFVVILVVLQFAVMIVIIFPYIYIFGLIGFVKDSDGNLQKIFRR